MSLGFAALAAFAGRLAAAGLSAPPPVFAGRVFFGVAAFAGDVEVPPRDLRAGVAGCLAAFAVPDGRFAAFVAPDGRFAAFVAPDGPFAAFFPPAGRLAAVAVFPARFAAFAGALRPDVRAAVLPAPPVDLRGDLPARVAFPADLRVDPADFPAVAFFVDFLPVFLTAAFFTADFFTADFFTADFFTADFFAPAFFGR